MSRSNASKGPKRVLGARLGRRNDEIRLRNGGRRRPMTLRGRATLVAAGLAAVLGLWAVAGGASRGAAPVAAAPRLAAVAPGLPPAGLFEHLPLGDQLYADRADARPGDKLLEEVVSDDGRRFQVEYTFDVALSREVHRVLREGKVALGHVVVLDPASGDVLAYVTTDPEAFPPTAVYPAASLVKVVTAAAALDEGVGSAGCRSVGSPWRLTRARIHPDPQGRAVSLKRALATSNNQCFAQIAVHGLGATRMLAALHRFGWLDAPALAHSAGIAEDPGEDAFALGRLGCGLDGCRITPLHAAGLAATLADGRRTAPRWITSVRDASGKALPLPAVPEPQRALSPELTAQLREMLVGTTERGTARRAFRRRGKPLLQSLRVAGKTGSLNGRDPDGRYEWFIAAAPADQPRIAVAALVVHGRQWWLSPAQVSAEVLKALFCPRGVCSAEAIDRWLAPDPPSGLALSESASEGQPGS